MDIVCLQHVAFEGPALLETWLEKKGIALKTILVPESPLPDVQDCRAVIVMGGPMNIYQHRNHPWLVAEKKFLRQCLDQKVPVLGVCLGAQLLADVLGARVVQNPLREIGWFPIETTPEFLQEFPTHPHKQTVLHWHGDTFELPAGAIRVATSEACKEQGFYIPGSCLGLQFHVESTDASVTSLMAHCADELTEDPFVQTPCQIKGGADPSTFSRWEPVFERLFKI